MGKNEKSLCMASDGASSLQNRSGRISGIGTNQKLGTAGNKRIGGLRNALRSR